VEAGAGAEVAAALLSKQQKKVLEIVAKELPRIQTEATESSSRVNLEEVEAKLAAKVKEMKENRKKSSKDDEIAELVACSKEMSKSVSQLTNILAQLVQQQLPPPAPHPPQ
jgi:hypothetical protein